MPHLYTSRVGLALAMIPAVFGANALLRPEAALASVQFPVPSDAQSRKLTGSLMRIYGFRNVAISYLLALIWSTGDNKLQGYGLAVGLGMSLVDGLISRHQIGGGEWNHWTFAPVISAVCADLISWFD